MSMDGMGYNDVITPENFAAAMEKLQGRSSVPDDDVDLGAFGDDDDSGVIESGVPAADPRSRLRPINAPRSDISPESEPTTELPDEILIDGQPVPMAVVRDMVQFDTFLRNNPVAGERIRQALDPNFQVAPVSAPPVEVPPPPPDYSSEYAFSEDYDADDPNNKLILENLQRIQQQQQEFTDYIARQEAAAATQLMQRGIQRFSEKYNSVLSEADIAAIRNASVSLYPSFMERDNNNVEQATFDVLDYTMWSIPDVRGKLMQHEAETSDQQLADAKARQRKLTALAGGGSGNANSVPPSIDERDTKQAIVRELRNSMNGTEQ